MQYLLLIYGNETEAAELSEAENAEVMQGYMAFNETVRATGQEVVGEPLQTTETATTVRVRDGKTVVTDGPFAETKEQLGGYYQIEAASQAEAEALAAQIPTAKSGCVEVRPLLVLEFPE